MIYFVSENEMKTAAESALWYESFLTILTKINTSASQ